MVNFVVEGAVVKATLVLLRGCCGEEYYKDDVMKVTLGVRGGCCDVVKVTLFL